jgi:hypothetical protein
MGAFIYWIQRGHSKKKNRYNKEGKKWIKNDGRYCLIFIYNKTYTYEKGTNQPKSYHIFNDKIRI